MTYSPEKMLDRHHWPVYTTSLLCEQHMMPDREVLHFFSFPKLPCCEQNNEPSTPFHSQRALLLLPNGASVPGHATSGHAGL
jgi:hypothetical protein